MRWTHLAGIALIASASPLLGQAKKPAKPPAKAATPVQQVIPPKTVYWLSAATTSGFGITGGKPPSAGDMMRMAMGGGGGGPSKTLQLDLGSKLPPSGPPLAAHAIPPGMSMGPTLALKSPKPDKPGKTGETRTPEDFERPKGKLLLFWGCGETAKPGQPIVIDFAKLAAGQIPPNLFAGERVRIAFPPSASTWPTWGGWPNDDKPSQKGVPSNASLIGPHKVTGNYTPEINFTLGQDWMVGLDMTQTKAASGALTLGWNAVPASTAYFAQMMGGAQGSEADGATIVFWSSSDLQTFISGLSDYIAPAEAARLVGKKQLMPPTQTTCAIPKEAMAATQGGLISLVAHGPEENFVYPPRPADPKVPWVQEWAVKARYAARTGGIAGMDMAAMGGGRTSSNNSSGKPKCQPATDPASMIGGSIGAAMGMFGKKKKNPDCE
jgi:hypothetical protein